MATHDILDNRSERVPHGRRLTVRERFSRPGGLIRGSWVEEVGAALEKERKQNKLVLFPIRLDDAVMETDQAWAASLHRMRHVGDFRAWKDHGQYQKSFEPLMRDLKAGST